MWFPEVLSECRAALSQHFSHAEVKIMVGSSLPARGEKSKSGKGGREHAQRGLQ